MKQSTEHANPAEELNLMHQKLERIRSKALGTSLRPLLLAAVFGFGAGSVTEYRAGRYDSVVLYLVLLILSFFALSLRTLDHRIRAGVLVFAFYAFGFSELYIFADTGMADVAFIMATIFAAVFLSQRVALGYMLLSFATLVTFALLYTLKFIAVPVVPPMLPTDAVMWTAYIVVLIFLSAVVYLLWRDYASELIQSMKAEATAIARLEAEIAERTKAEDALRESEQRWERLFDSVPDLVMLVNRELEIVLRNREGYRPNPGAISILDSLALEERDNIRATFDAVAKTETTAAIECEARFESNQAGWYAVQIVPSRTGEAVDGFIVIASDHTLQRKAEMERSRAEEAVRHELVFRESIIANAADGICLCHVIEEFPYIVFTMWNPKMLEITGFSLEELNSISWLDALFKDPEVRQRAADRAIGFRFGEVLAHDEWPIIRKDGDERTLLISTTSLHENLTGHPRSILGVVIDVTDRKRESEEKDRLRAQLMQAQKMESVGRLAGGVAHDFNNMLGVILGTAELGLLNLSPEDPSREPFEEIHKAAIRSAELTKQLLAFARKQTVSPLVLDLNTVGQGMHRMLQRLIGEDIQLVWAPAQSLHLVKVDPMQLEQILANLVVNARDAIEGHGDVRIETRNVYLDETQCAEHESVAPGNYVLLSVTDNGSGMTEEVIAHIFEPFFTTKGIGKGTGLGMATVYGIVKQNDGLITVTSTPGQGSTISIYLPEFDAPSADTFPSVPVTPARQACNARVLLVEDEKSVLKMTQQLLETQGYDVTAVSSGIHALAEEKRLGKVFDLLITDVVMPDMNGRQLRDNLQERQPAIRTLFMSGYPADVIAKQGIVETSVDFIQKPFSIRDFLDKVQSVIEG